MCLCSYHANFIEAVNALHKKVPSLPSYDDGFVKMFLCRNSTMDCWYGNCENCDGISVNRLTEMIANVDLNTNAAWILWKKSVVAKRVEKHEETGTLLVLIAHISALSSQFLKHSFNKRQQDEMFSCYDRVRALSKNCFEKGVLQIDFAENFVCEAQDEIQSAHWNQRQISLFTSGFYYNESFCAKVLVSDNLTHTKDTIVTYLFKLLSKLPPTLKILKIWSDGPSSQFKNKYIAALIPVLQDKFKVQIIWNYFATSHGKGCVDGIGATVKTIVRKHIRARNMLVNSSSEFVAAFNLTESTIAVEEVALKEFDAVNSDLDADTLFLHAKNIQNISGMHQIKIIDNRPAVFCNSKQGYFGCN